MKANKHLFKILLLILSTPFFCYAQKKNVIIKISQEETITADEFQTNLTLKKRPFKFKILLNNTDGVYVFASLRDSVYRFTETSPIYDFSYLKLLEIREEDKFNANKELSLSETGWSYWFYNDTAEWHPFSRNIVTFQNGQYVCTKVIKSFFDYADRKVIRLKDLNAPLYLFFVAVKDYDANGKPLTELLRKKIKIDWVDDD